VSQTSNSLTITLFMVDASTPPKYICTNLKLDIEHLGESQDDLDLVLERASDPALFDELRIEGDLLAHLTVFEISDGSLRLEGSMEGSQLLTCVRTLETFSNPFDFEVALEIVKDASTREQVLEDEDEELFRFRIPVLQESVDITECIRQLVILHEPMNPVKDPAQKFIWKDSEPVDENSTKPVDPRWDKLKELKQKLEKPQ